MQLGEVQRLNGLAETYRQRSSSIALRKEILEKQKVHNYQSEYDRIRAHLEDSSIPHQTREGIRSRTHHLKALGALALSGMT